jgi:ribosomal protein S19E (S16A)
MPIRSDTVLRNVEQMSNEVNSDLLKDFYGHMKDNGTSQNYQKGNLKAMIHFVEDTGAATSFYDVDHKQVVRFLDTKIKPEQIDSDKKWITTTASLLIRTVGATDITITTNLTTEKAIASSNNNTNVTLGNLFYRAKSQKHTTQ